MLDPIIEPGTPAITSPSGARFGAGRSVEIVVKRFRNVARLACLGLPLFAGACGIYLHDADLASSTSKVAEDSKAAAEAMASALKAERDAFATHIEVEARAVTENERSRRDVAIAGLIVVENNSRPEFDCVGATVVNGKWAFASRLRRRGECRMHAIAGVGGIGHGRWTEQALAIEQSRSMLNTTKNKLGLIAAEFEAASGEKFTGCSVLAEMPGPETGTPAANFYLKLGRICEAIARLESGADEQVTAVDELKAAATKGSELFRLVTWRNTLGEQREEVAQDKKNAEIALAAAKQDVDEASRKPEAEAELRVALKKLDDLVSLADKVVGSAAGAVGGTVKLGQVLAAVEFRETNLRELLISLANPAETGNAGASQPGQVLQRQIVGLVVNLQALSETVGPNAKTPSIAELTVALAQQESLAAARRTELQALEHRLYLLDLQIEALVQEYGLLDQALVAVEKLEDLARCNAADFDILFSTCDKQSQRHASRALLAYGQALTKGQAGGRMASVRESQVLRDRLLRVAEANAATRLQIVTLATDEMAAYGAGGVKTETILEFLKTVGLGFIAAGVN